MEVGMAKSRYDEIHDKYHTILSTKQGTRYEILTAFLLKKLEQDEVVIHDLELSGDSGVKHQIDVTVRSKEGNLRRILIECKDFDVSGDKVGLDIIRNFSAVVDDIHPDESIILTCNGFTRDAQKFAKHKGIKLAVLREFKESDWEGRIKSIHLTFHIIGTSTPQVTFAVTNEEDRKKITDDIQSIKGGSAGLWRGQPVCLNLPGERVQVNDFIERKMKEVSWDSPRHVDMKVPLVDATIEVENRGGVPIAGLLIQFDIMRDTKFMKVTSDKVAELITEGFDENDLIVFDQDLKRFMVDANTGEIVER
ncbi:MAG: restriction endonuclease [Bdellovibrionota bacterium]